jgi:hypothetical protein
MKTAAGLAALPLPSLLRSTTVLHACGSDALVRAGSALITRAAKAGALGGPVVAMAKATVFRQFVAGESLSDVKAISNGLLSAGGVRCIVDHSVEEGEAEHERRSNLEAKLQLLQTLSGELGASCAFVPIKLTSLVDPSLLERLTEGAPKAGDLQGAADAASLDETERGELSRALSTLRELCGGAASVGVPLLLDAEQTHRQPAIRLLARTLASEFNSPTAPPIVYDTHQAYLRGTRERIAEELELAERGGYTLAVKLVRGAYRGSEAMRGGGSQLQPTKGHTDAEYDECARLLVESSCAEKPTGALVLATHNRASTFRVVEAMNAHGVPNEHARVHFAQILGMADDLTLSLGLAGLNALKLVPFGHFSQVLPWLLRRLEENQDALAAAATERPLLRGELQRRAAAALGQPSGPVS